MISYDLIINEFFLIQKLKADFQTFSTSKKFDVVFYDAFSPASQPELWEQPLLEKIYNLMNPEGMLTTYCAKGAFKRTLKTIGFEVESLPGPVGKREITRALKN